MTLTSPMVSPLSSVVGESETETTFFTPFWAMNSFTASSSVFSSFMVFNGRISIPKDLILIATGHLHNLLDPRHFVLQGLFDPHLEGHGGHRAVAAGPDQPYLDHPVIAHLHQFHVAAVRLQRGTDHLQHLFDLFNHWQSPFEF